MIMRQFKILIGDTDAPFEIRVPKIGVETYLAPIKLTSLDGIDFAFDLEIEVAQSGTAGYNGLLINVTETSTGSGSKLPFEVKVDGASVASIDNAGVFTGNGSGLTNLPVGTGDLRADGTVPLTANWNVGSFLITALTLTATGKVIAQTTALSDSEFYMGSVGTDPKLNFAPKDAIKYIRSTNEWQFDQNGTDALALSRAAAKFAGKVYFAQFDLSTADVFYAGMEDDDKPIIVWDTDAQTRFDRANDRYEWYTSDTLQLSLNNTTADFQDNTIKTSGDLILTGLPTSDPTVTGQVWNDNGTLKISTG